MIVLYVLFFWMLVRAGQGPRPSRAVPTLQWAIVLLLVVWFAYPVVYGLQGLTVTGTTLVTAQVVLSVADIIAKIGFGVLLHRVAVIRSAEDVDAGLDVLPERSWMNGEPLTEQRAGGGLAGATGPTIRRR